MTQKSVLLIGVDGEPLRQMEAMLAATGAFNLALLTGTDDAAALDDAPEPALIITYLQDGEGLGAVDAALSARSLAQTAVPLVVVCAAYDQAEALTAFRMGVSEYLGLHEHGDRFVAVVAELLEVKLDERVVDELEPSDTIEPVFAGSSRV